MAAGILVVGTTLDPLPSLSVEGQRTLAVFLSALVLWLTRSMPYVVLSLLSVTLLFVLGAVDSFDAATTGFTSRWFSSSWRCYCWVMPRRASFSIGTVGFFDSQAVRLLQFRNHVQQITLETGQIVHIIPPDSQRHKNGDDSVPSNMKDRDSFNRVWKSFYIGVLEFRIHGKDGHTG